MILDSKSEIISFIGKIFPECDVHIGLVIGIDIFIESTEFIGPVDKVPRVIIVVPKHQHIMRPVLVIVVGNLYTATCVEIVAVMLVPDV